MRESRIILTQREVSFQPAYASILGDRGVPDFELGGRGGSMGFQGVVNGSRKKL